jgi:mannan endo-1,4-beta-mannosidase
MVVALRCAFAALLSAITVAAQSFVKVSGQKFTVGGAPYIVAGTNGYWIAQNSNADIDQAFQDIAAAGLTTVRTW